MRTRKPGTKTGNDTFPGSNLDEHHGNLRIPKNPQKCFAYASDILMKGWEFFPQNTGLFKLSLYWFTFLRAAGQKLQAKTLTPNSTGKAFVQSGRKWWIQDT